jgi:hypothetical protein
MNQSLTKLPHSLRLIISFLRLALGLDFFYLEMCFFISGEKNNEEWPADNGYFQFFFTNTVNPFRFLYLSFSTNGKFFRSVSK